jgi:hypothetical protein
MTRTVLISIAIVVTLAASAAASEPRPVVGGKLGLNVANWWGDDAEDLDSRVAMNIGGYLEYPIAPPISVQIELNYSMKGAQESVPYYYGLTATDVTVTGKLSYIETPVLLRLRLPTEEVGLYVLGGPALALKMSSKIEAEANGASAEVDWENVNDLDLGFVVGGGLQIPTEPILIFGEARFTVGLISVDDSQFDEDLKNLVMSFNVGVGIPL